MSQSRIHWGILGIGSPNASTIANAIEASVTGALVAIAGSRMSAASFAETFIGKTSPDDISVYDEFEELLADSNVHAVYITLPNIHHYEWIIKALAAGKHVLCDPPLSLSSTQMLSIINKVKALYNIFCMEAMSYRLHPFFKDLKKIIVTDKKLGDVRLFNATYTMDYSGDSNFRGGSILDVGYHPLSFIRHLLDVDAEPTSIFGTGTIDTKTRKDSEASLILHYKNGIKATIQTANDISSSWLFQVIGTKGSLQVISHPWLPGNYTTIHLKLFEPGKPNNNLPFDEIGSFYEKPPYILPSYAVDTLGECVRNKALSEDAVTLAHTWGNIKIVEEWRRQVLEKKSSLDQRQSSVNNVSYFKQPSAEDKKVQPEVKARLWKRQP